MFAYICRMKQKLDDTIAFRPLPGNGKFIIDICEKNKISVSDLMQYMTNYYIESKDVIKFIIEIKR